MCSGAGNDSAKAAPSSSSAAKRWPSAPMAAPIPTNSSSTSRIRPAWRSSAKRSIAAHKDRCGSADDLVIGFQLTHSGPVLQTQRQVPPRTARCLSASPPRPDLPGHQRRPGLDRQRAGAARRRLRRRGPASPGMSAPTSWTSSIATATSSTNSSAPSPARANTAAPSRTAPASCATSLPPSAPAGTASSSPSASAPLTSCPSNPTRRCRAPASPAPVCPKISPAACLINTPLVLTSRTPLLTT